MVTTILGRDEELRSLWNEHLEFERRLEVLDGLAHLTPDEEIERKQLQKLKLAGKTRIAQTTSLRIESRTPPAKNAEPSTTSKSTSALSTSLPNWSLTLKRSRLVPPATRES